MEIIPSRTLERPAQRPDGATGGRHVVVPHAENIVSGTEAAGAARFGAWWLYIQPAQGSIPCRSTRHYRRLAARSKTSRAQVDVSLPAARSSSARSSAVSRIRNSACLRFSGGSGGRPIFGFFSMPKV